MGELLDFTGRKDFEDLKFGKGYNLTQDDIVAFKEDCMRIKNTNDKMALEQCKLGLQLAELKAGKTWQSVINQKTGFAYLVQSFEDFCKDTFKFSGTKTYALMQIAKFVTSNSENEVHFIDEKYSEFSSSQLTELASVPTYKRHLFTPNMTVDDMRTIKKYIATDAFLEDRQKEDFDLLTYAKSKKTPKALPASKPDVLPGQQSLFPEENDDGESEISPTSGKSEPGEAQEVSEEERESAIKTALTSYENQAVRIYKKYKENPLHSEFVDYIKHAYGLGGSYRNYLSLDYNHKGLTIRKDTETFKEIFTVFLSWAQVTQRIVTLINNNEYLNPTVKYAIDTQREPQESTVANDGESEISPTSGKSESGEEIEQKYIPERDEYEELDETQEDMRADMKTIEQEAEESVSGKYCFGARAHVRNFISDYQAWPGRCGHFFLSPCWCYSLKNGAVIYAMTYDSFVDFSENITTKRVLYFLQEKGSKNAIELSKEQFERWCSEHKQEL